MLNQMRQSNNQQMQQQFDGLAEQSMANSGVQPTADNPIETIASMVAGSILATASSAADNGKKIPPNVVLQSAFNMAAKLLQNLNLQEQQLEEAMAAVFFEAMEMLIGMGQGVLPDEDLQLYQGFMQEVAKGMQGEQQGQPAQEQPQQPQQGV